MLEDFLNQTCSITSKTISVVWWEETTTFTPVYTSIPCYYYQQSQTLKVTDEALNTDVSDYRVIIEASRVNVRKDMIIEISDPNIWNIWKYLIEWVKVNYLIDWSIDSIQLIIKKYV